MHIITDTSVLAELFYYVLGTPGCGTRKTRVLALLVFVYKWERRSLSNCTNFGNIVTMRGPIKEEHRTLGEKITERLAQSEKFPWTNDLTDVSIEWWDINWVKKGEKSTLGRWVRIQAGGRFEDWKKAKCGQDKDSPGKWAAWHWKAAKDQPGSLRPVDHVMVSVFILRTKGNRQESLGNSESGKWNTFILYFQFSHHSTDYQPMC